MRHTVGGVVGCCNLACITVPGVCGCQGCLKDDKDLTYENLFFGARSTRGQWRWEQSVTGCWFGRSNSGLNFLFCAAAFVTTMVFIILDAQTRHLVPDKDGDGDPGSPHYGKPVPWGFEIVHVAYVALAFYFLMRMVLLASLFYKLYYGIESSELAPPMARLVRVAYAIALPLNVVAGIVYFSFLVDNDNLSHITTVSYSVNFSFMVADWIFCSMPFLPAESIYSLGIGLIYALVVTPAHYLLYTTADDRYPYIYASLDWSNPPLALLHVTAYTALTYFVCCVLCIWSRIRPHINDMLEFDAVDMGSRVVPTDFGNDEDASTDTETDAALSKEQRSEQRVATV